MMPNRKLFPNTARSQAERSKLESAAAVLRNMQREARFPSSRVYEDIVRQSQRLRRLLGRSASRELRNAIQEIEQQASSGAGGVVANVLNRLGLPGQMVSRWLGGQENREGLRELERKVVDALTLYEQFNPDPDFEVRTPEQAGGQRVRERDPVVPVSPLQSGVTSPPSDERRAKPHRNVEVLPDGRWKITAPAYRRILRPDSPLLDGRMIPVVSSNVHSIGYEFDLDNPAKGNLIVRYLQSDKKSSGRSGAKVAGPTYRYFAVHPDWFLLFTRAGSKGKWVWDNLRIRGTVAGHQYRYSLIRIAQMYVPRRARVINGRQVLTRRTNVAELPGGRRVQVRSQLPSRVIGAYRPSVKRPNVGNPDRGRARR